MTGSCQRCGAPSGTHRHCQTHRLTHGHDDTATDGDHHPPDDTAHECTDCQTVYLYPEHQKCPNCGSRRRRYAGPLDGRLLPARPSQMEVDL